MGVHLHHSPLLAAALAFTALAAISLLDAPHSPRGLRLSRTGGSVVRRNVGVRSGRVAASAEAGKKLLVLGGSGFVGREVCKNAVEKGYQVTSLSRRGENPDPSDPLLKQVNWVKGNALDEMTVRGLVEEKYDAVVHAMGLLFDIKSGMPQMNLIVSGSRSEPDDTSTYDNITRRTAEILLDQISKNRGNKPTPVAFVSAAEAGWPQMSGGSTVENVAPDWLKRYLTAKRAVEAMMESNQSIRPIVYRPSLIWNWGKLDVLPVIPIFNLANALGVPFVDKTVRVETLAKAIVEGIDNDSVTGVQRFPQIETLGAGAA
mmetsp:Transcript_26647/g.51642  ORF Transcript_26647/g.51642 Transcript_26647/m.51642 type:complete len:317 (+) Transcript_26647:37-987(+)